jgi:hypothetical protein
MSRLPGFLPDNLFFLFLDCVTDIFDDLANLAPGAAYRILRFARGLIGDAFVVQVGVVREITSGLLDVTLECFSLAFEFIAIHWTSPV